MEVQVGLPLLELLRTVNGGPSLHMNGEPSHLANTVTQYEKMSQYLHVDDLKSIIKCNEAP